jgi:hypothetical protein
MRQQRLTAQRGEVTQAIHDNKDEVSVLKLNTVSAIAWIGWLPMWLCIALYEIRDYNNRPEFTLPVFFIAVFIWAIADARCVYYIQKN